MSWQHFYIDIYTVDALHGRRGTSVHHLHAWPILLRLPPIKDKLRFASIAGSHSNQVMRMWFYGMQHASEKLTTGGRLSSEILQRSDALYWQAVHHGVEWEIISSLVPATWKNFASLASSAANSAQQVSQGERFACLQEECQHMAGKSRRQAHDIPGDDANSSEEQAAQN